MASSSQSWGLGSSLCVDCAKSLVNGIWFAWPGMSSAWQCYVQKLDKGRKCREKHSKSRKYRSKCLFFKQIQNQTDFRILKSDRLLGSRFNRAPAGPTNAIREAEIANRPFLGALAGCSARRCERRVASHTSEEQRRNAPGSAAENGILAFSASLSLETAVGRARACRSAAQSGA